MDTTIILVIAIFALIVIGFLIVFQRRGKAEIRGPLNMGLKIEGSNEPQPTARGINVEGAKSHSGGLKAADKAGGHVNVRNVEVEKNIEVTRSASSTDSDPKVSPPT